MKRLLLLLLLLPIASFADSRIVFHSHLRFRYDVQQFPDAREDVKRFHIQWKPLLEFRIHPSLDAGIEAFADATHESDEEDFLPGFAFPQFHSPVFERDNINDDVFLSKAFLRYSPSPHLEIVGGKFENPFLHTELLWADNLTPNGGAFTASYTSASGGITVRGRIGDFYASQYLDDDINVVAIQGVLQGDVGIARITTGISYYDHSINSLDPRLLRTNSKSGTHLLNDYNILDLIGRVRFNLVFPFTAQIDYVKNTAANTFSAGAGNGDSGYLIDLFAGQLQEAGQFRAGVSFHHVESDAVLAAYNTDEWWFPTRGEGYRIHGGVVVHRGITVSGSYLHQTLIDLSAKFERWMLTVDIDWP
jgi:hypothetical protein